ncbi:MAG: sigma-70 family RNA polymerase sigma factor [Candidatus Kapaibacterium sp.]
MNTHSMENELRQRALLYLTRLCNTHEEAEDIIEDALCVLVQRYNIIEDMFDERRFFYVVLNQYNNYRRKRQVRAKYTIAWDSNSIKSRPIEESENLDLTIDIQCALNRITKDNRRLLLDWWKGYSYEELAVNYRVSLSCMKMRLKRAKAQFLREMEGYS